jgi:hypothetical protein
MPLTDTVIRNAKPSEKTRRLYDEGRLYLEVSPAGGKLWRLKYRISGKEKLLALGKYPAVNLKEARERRDEAKHLLSNGVDPSEVKKAQKQARHDRDASTFESVAAKWFEKWETEVTESTAKSQRERLAKHITPILGPFPVADIDAPMVLAALKPLEARGTGDTLRKAKMAIGQIMDFAVQHGWAKHNPVGSLRGAFKATLVKHRSAIIAPVKLGQLLREIDHYPGSSSIAAALKLLPLLFCRLGELWGGAMGRHRPARGRVEIHRQQDENGTPRSAPTANFKGGVQTGVGFLEAVSRNGECGR